MTGSSPIAVSLGTAVPEQLAVEEALARLEVDVAPDASLLVLAEDAGSATAHRFYADALRTGVALASPGPFPWCLANAPCGAAARRFGIVGANVTWLVQSLDAPEGYDPVAAWLAGDTGEALVIALRTAPPWPRLVAWHVPSGDARPASAELHHGWTAAADVAPD